jgi:hypothetical protein
MPSEVTTAAIDPRPEELGPRLTDSREPHQSRTDRLGRQHRHDAQGRFSRKTDGGIKSLSADARRLVNDKTLLPGVDGRSLTYKRYRELVSAIAIDQGGAENLSAARAQLIRRYAAASVLAEQMEIRLAAGEEIDVERFSLLCSTLVRVAARIGINRIPRNLTPTVADYVSHIYDMEAAE